MSIALTKLADDGLPQLQSADNNVVTRLRDITMKTSMKFEYETCDELLSGLE